MQYNIKSVIKKDGRKELFDISKVNRWEDIAYSLGVSWHDIVKTSLDSLYDGVKTSEIQISLIKSCVSKQDETHLKLASILLASHIFSEVEFSTNIDDSNSIHFKDRYNTLVKRGYWEPLKKENEKEILDRASELIDYKYDMSYNYSSLKQWYDKIALKDMSTGKVIETFQESLMRVAMYNLDLPQDIELFYTYAKKQYINIATPIFTSSGTGENAQASCCVIRAEDTKESISIANMLVYLMTANRSGIGYELNSRSIDDIVGNNKCKHTGKLPVYNMTVISSKAVSQGSRGGSVTTTFNSLDPELVTLLNLKFPTTPPDRRINTMDYSMSVRNEFLRRVAKNDIWVLVSLKDEPELYHHYFNSFGDSEHLFVNRLVEVIDLVVSGKLKGKIVKARDIFNLWLKARVETGNMYITCLDNINNHTPFLEPISQSNLCQEICLPTKGYMNFDELVSDYKLGNGLTSLCFLSAIDVGKVPDDLVYFNCCYIVSKLLDNIITNLDYSFKNIESSSNYYRNIGVGITNLAYYLAKRGVKYSEKAGKDLIHRLSERHLYCMLKASTKLAKERGKCKNFYNTKYSYDILPIDTYNKNVDSVVDNKLYFNWSSLREEIKEHGLRFSVHTAHMPCESSSLLGYSTNGLYPIRDGIISKKRTEGNLLFIAPEWEKLKDSYESAWDIATRDLYDMYAIVQKFTEQAISADDYANYTNNSKLSRDEMTGDILYGVKMGIKTLYYKNSRTNTGVIKRETDNIFEESAKFCPINIDDSDDCDACKL